MKPVITAQTMRRCEEINFAAGSADALELPNQLPTVELSFFDTIIDFVADILRAIGEFIGVIFQ